MSATGIADTGSGFHLDVDTACRHLQVGSDVGNQSAAGAMPHPNRRPDTQSLVGLPRSGSYWMAFPAEAGGSLDVKGSMAYGAGRMPPPRWRDPASMPSAQAPRQINALDLTRAWRRRFCVRQGGRGSAPAFGRHSGAGDPAPHHASRPASHGADIPHRTPFSQGKRISLLGNPGDLHRTSLAKDAVAFLRISFSRLRRRFSARRLESSRSSGVTPLLPAPLSWPSADAFIP
jgi:hypothetical protein